MGKRATKEKMKKLEFENGKRHQVDVVILEG